MLSAPFPTRFVAEAAVLLQPAPASVLAAGSLRSGGHAVAWLSQPDAALHLQSFDGTGVRGGTVVQLAADSTLDMPAIAVLPDGSFVVAAAVSAPVSARTPWITRTAISVRRHGADGAPLGAAVQVGAVEQDRIGVATMQYVAAPALATWTDGSFVVAWAQLEEGAGGRKPRFASQRFDAAGQPVGATSATAEGDRGTGFRLTAAPAGGWLLTTTHRIFGRTVLRHHAFNGATAPVQQDGALGWAEGSLLLPLHGGRMALLQPAHVYGSLQLYGADGQPAGMGGALAALPSAAVATLDGGFVTFTPAHGQLLAQRFDAAGRTSGDPVAAGAGTAALLGTGLESGGVAIGWSDARGAWSQRLR